MKSANLLLVLSALVVSSSSGRDYPGTDYRSIDQCSCVHVNQCNDHVIRSTQSRVYIDSRGVQKQCFEDSQVCCRNEFVVGTTALKQNPTFGDHNMINTSFKRLFHNSFNGESYKEFPWTVAVMREEWGLYDTYLGGGALIHPQVVVTAAHLVERTISMEQSIANILVKHPTQDLKVARVIIHEELNSENLENDIALLILKEPVNMTNPNVGLICLPEANQSMEGLKCLTTGWNTVFRQWTKHNTGLYLSSFKKMSMVVKSKTKCESLRNFEHESFLCGHGVKKQLYCEDQSGSPLLCPSLTEKDVYVLAGIVMRRNYPCGFREPGVFADVSHFVNWINAKLTAIGINLPCSSVINTKQPDAKTLIDNQKRQNIFDAELLKSVSLKENGNFLISPVSVKALLSLVMEGATGQTLYKILDVLKLPQDIETARTLLTGLQNVLQVKTSNHISAIVDLHSNAFVSKRYKTNSTYKRTLKSVYEAEVTSQDFLSPNVAANAINRWINDQTRGMIPELIEAASISPDTLAILVSAVYFKGVWKTTFLERDTKTRCFYSEPSFECQNVPTMFLTEDLPYKFDEKLDAHILRIPYEDERFSMVLVVPNEKEGMQQLQSRASSLSVPDLLNGTKYIEVELHLPRFTIEHKTDLKSVLGDLGLEEIFTDSAQLPYIVNNMPGKVSEMMQKAKIEVSENGTKASAASEVGVVLLSYSDTVYLNVDHPFYYFIFEERSQTVLFSGRLSSMAGATGARSKQPKRDGGKSRRLLGISPKRPTLML